MKYFKLILLVITVFQFKIEASAQSSKKERQEIYKGALNLLDDYELAYSFKNERDHDRFESLFMDLEIEVFNDIMPENSLNEKEKLGQYYELWYKHYSDKKLLNVYIEPYEMGTVFLYDNSNKTGYIDIGAYKICSGKTDEGVNYVDTFDINVKVDFNLTSDIFKIADINANRSYGSYCVLELDFNDIPQESNSIIIERDEGVISASDMVVCPDKFYVLKDIKENTQIKVSAKNETLIPTYAIAPSDSRKPIIFRKPKWYVEFDFGINPFKNSPVVFRGDSMNINSVNELSYNIGFNIGYAILPSQNVYIKTGLLFNHLNYTTQLDEYLYKNKSIDSDAFPYLRTNKVGKISENIELQFLKIPILIQKKINIKESKMYILTELGAIWNLSLNSKYKSNAEGSYSGFYETLFEINLAENGVYDFGDFDLKDDGVLKVESTSLSYYGAIGIGRKLDRRFSMVFMGAYSQGTSNLFEEDYQGLSDNYSELESITNVSNNFTLQEIYLSLKLNYNF